MIDTIDFWISCWIIN